MELYKTTILPTDDDDLAKKLFESLVFEQPYCLLVVLGKGPDAEKFVQRASKLTGRQHEPRWVVWAREPNQIKATLADLANSDKIIGQLDTARGFCLSLSDEVRDVISKSDSVPNLTRILLAFAEGERS
jgi:hypothetical protein